MQQIDETMGFGFKKKVLPTEEEIKAWVNDQRESGKKRNSEGEPFQFDNHELVEEEYQKKKFNGGLSSCQWLEHDKHLFGKSWQNFDEDEWSFKVGAEYEAREHAIFANYSIHYYSAYNGRLLPWHEVKACNGIVWRHRETYLTENEDKCAYVGPPRKKCKYDYGPGKSDYAIHTRGNCLVCGGNGPLARRCINKCNYIPKEKMKNRKKKYEGQHSLIFEWVDNGEASKGKSIYRMMRTPDNKGVVDAEFYSEACFKEPKSDLEHYIMSFANKEYKARARVSPRKSRIYYMPTTYPEFMRSIIYSFHLREDDTAWKKVVKLCEEKDTDIRPTSRKMQFIFQIGIHTDYHLIRMERQHCRSVLTVVKI